MIRRQAIIIALGLLLISGLWHGLCTERWQPSAALGEAIARVEHVPLQIGDWQGQAEKEEADEFDMAGARGHWTRTYVHKHGGARLLVILMCGRAARMSVHTPQVCYGGAGYDMPNDPVRFHMAAEPAGTFWTATFSKRSGEASELRLYWAWNAHGPWEAADNPRWQFRGAPFLYKLYVAHDLTGTADPGPAADVGAEFLRQFLPVLDRTLFPSGL
jgi:hypothetical protein